VIKFAGIEAEWSVDWTFHKSRSASRRRVLRCINFSGRLSESGLVSRVSPVHTALRNCTRDEGRSFEVGNQVLISSHRKLLCPKDTVVNVVEKSGRDSGRQDRERRAQANCF
jgi:hypothetical protein